MLPLVPCTVPSTGEDAMTTPNVMLAISSDEYLRHKATVVFIASTPAKIGGALAILLQQGRDTELSEQLPCESQQ